MDDFECPEPEGFYEYPDNCIKYIQCHSNYPLVNICPEDDGE